MSVTTSSETTLWVMFAHVGRQSCCHDSAWGRSFYVCHMTHKPCHGARWCCWNHGERFFFKHLPTVYRGFLLAITRRGKVIKIFRETSSGWAQMVKNLPATQEPQVRSLGQEDPLEKETATHSSIPAWRIPWTEEPGGLKSMGSQKVAHNWVIKTFTYFLQDNPVNFIQTSQSEIV